MPPLSNTALRPKLIRAAGLALLVMPVALVAGCNPPPPPPPQPQPVYVAPPPPPPAPVPPARG